MSRLAVPRLVLAGVSYAYDARPPVLSDVSLPLTPGWTGVVGGNGAGKSTLLGLLSGRLTPTRGQVRREGIGAVHACPQLPVRDAAVDAFAADWEHPAPLLRARLRLDPDRLDAWDRSSPGERRRWQLGAALAAAPDLLLLDEPTNHLDGQARALLVDALRTFAGVGVVVSHDRALLDALTTATVRVERGGAERFDGAWSQARAAWEAEAEAARATRDAAQAAVRATRRQLADARRSQDAAAGQIHASARMKDRHDHDARSMGRKTLASWADARRGQDVGRLRNALERREEDAARAALPTERGGPITFPSVPCPRARVAALAGPLRVGEREVWVDRVWARGAKVQVAGPNGAGKTTLLRALVAQAGAGVAYVPQEAPDGDALLNALRRSPPDVRGRVGQLLAALGADPGRLLAGGTPSPGEARKLALADALGRGAFALALDEPTNDLDLPAVERLGEALTAWPGALLLVTHDPALAAVAGETWVL